MQKKYPWINWLWKNRIHALVFILLAGYLFSANFWYVTFFLKDGKPLRPSPEIPNQTVEMVLKITDYDSRLHDGQELYEIRGYVFAPGIPGSTDYKKTLILHSTRDNLFFAADKEYRQELSKKFPEYQGDINQAGFHLLISKDVLKRDNYRLGFLLEAPDGSTRVYQWFDTYIQREPNRLRLIGEP